MKHLLILLLCSSCYSFEFDQTISYDVDPELLKYVDSFYQEAKERGLFIQRENLLVKFENDIPNLLAQNANEGEQIIINVDRVDYEWILNNWGTEAVENLMFHELGHGLLNRDHNDPKESIMASGHSLRSYLGDPVKRKYLLDELFGL